MMRLEFDDQELLTQHGVRIWAGLRGSFDIDRGGEIISIDVLAKRRSNDGWEPIQIHPEDGALYEDLHRSLEVDYRHRIDEELEALRFDAADQRADRAYDDRALE